MAQLEQLKKMPDTVCCDAGHYVGALLS